MRRIVRIALPLSVLLVVAIARARAPATAAVLSFAPVHPGIERAALEVRTFPDAAPTRLWIYRPAVRVPPATWPCVLVAASGSTGATGVRLNEGDIAEHLPYVRQGFVVVAYELDGQVDAGLTADRYEVAVRAHVRSDGGIANLRTAIEVATRSEPSIDAKRIYLAGHGSAATLALRAAATVPAIRGVVAYAPLLDPLKSLGETTVEALDVLAPGLRAMLLERQPMAVAAEIRAPVMLFNALDDDRAPVEQARAMAEAMRAAGNSPLVVEWPRGGHVEAIMSRGLEAGAAWLADRAKRDAATEP